jgi:short-subunit dehydrogenase
MKQLKDKCILLTGASRGVGVFIAQALARQGARLALVARSQDLLQKLANELGLKEENVRVVGADLTDDSDRRRVVDRVLEAFGKIDILINNAGLEAEGAFLDLSIADVRNAVELNLMAPMALTHLVLPHMVDHKSGHIVNISSIGGKSGAPYDATYCGTKAGLAEWTRGLRIEMEGTGVDFSTIFPGFVTEVGMFARFNMKTPWVIGACTPEQVADAVVKAIQHKKREIIVNSQPLRPIFALSALFPGVGDWLMHRTGVVAFQRRKVNKGGGAKKR